ncbi:uncharacterized protein RSE6_03709 [Rhynchosporium secalis]|uniref:Regulator of phospholipase D SRF1 n=1 Tax=Rhynchosporium secalis TaxID=38038 RepID=A0A1E1M3G2_RHYSE|nr:uncharacterized protein RSE6_03709 [Rhynchosporium secalis]
MASSDNASLTASAPWPQLDSQHILHYGPPLRTSRQTSDASSASSGEAAMRTKGILKNRAAAYSSSSQNTQASGSTHRKSVIAQRAVKSLPPWVASYEEEDGDSPKASSQLLSAPPRAHAAQHHYAPNAPNAPILATRMSHDGYIETIREGSAIKKTETGFFGGVKEPVRGRKWDHVRDAEPVIMQGGDVPTASPWIPFIKSSMYAPTTNEDRKIVTPEFLQQQTPGYNRPWRGDLEQGEGSEKYSTHLHSKKKRKTFLVRSQRALISHALVPLGFRLTVLSTSIIALAISSSVHHLSNVYTYAQNASTTMAIVVDVVAIPYILYITYDEYTGKPLGLRQPKAKIRLVLLDLFFIIFESANLALAFTALTDRDGACRVGPTTDTNSIVCGRVMALCAILMIALIAWSLTFAVSIFRLVERVGGREEAD